MSKILFKIFDIAAFKVVEKKVTHTCELRKRNPIISGLPLPLLRLKVKKSIESGEKKRDTVKARPVTNSTTGRLRFEELQQGYILLW